MEFVEVWLELKSPGESAGISCINRGQQRAVAGAALGTQEAGVAAPSQGARLARIRQLNKTVASALKMEWEAAEARKTERLKMEDGSL